ncbi:MAG TPA: hypothetical protein VHZ25_14225 [Acidobacteriaceae bacterium]|jgi:xylan 1,4-beta-xylosidase|nr:hypothetical protein [Acidobacteriaceae bacterium]
MGSPAYPTVSQVTELRKASEIGPPEAIAIRNHQLTLAMPPMGLAVVEIR